jgi:hypothetical protein
MASIKEEKGEPKDIQMTYIETVPKNLGDVERDMELIEDGEVTLGTKLAILVRVLV